MRKLLFVVVAMTSLLASAALDGAVNWHTELVDSGGGYWRTRVAVEIENPSESPIAGQAVKMEIGNDAGQLPLAGSTTKSLRVVNVHGLEYLFRIEQRSDKKDVLSAADAFVFAVDVPAKSTTTYFIYADNSDADAVTEYLDESFPNSNQAENNYKPMNEHKTPTAAGVRIQVRTPERLKIEERLGSADWNPLTGGGDWRVRAEVRVVFMSAPKNGQALVTAYVARPVHMLRRLASGSLSAAQARVIDPVRKTEVPSVWAGDRIFFSAEVTRPGQQRFFVYFSPSGGTEAATEQVYSRMLRGPLNLVPTAAGAKSVPIPVAPNGTYVFAAWLRTEGLVEGFPAQSATWDLRGSFLAVDGKPVKNQKSFSALRSITGTTPWTLHASMVETPPDCASFQITVPKDDRVKQERVLLARVAAGIVTETRAADSETWRADVAAWSVNPMVKVFPDDPALPGGPISIFLARNEWEPAQLALRSRVALKDVHVSFDSVHNSSGAELPVHAYKVVFVPVDRPTAYYQTFVPAWCRKVPKGPGASDGWAGEWPDPLPPLKAFDLPSGRTQPLWFEIYAPPDAAPGEYNGTIRIEADGITAKRIPFKATVWNFTLSRAHHLKVVYDLRSGPGWDVTEGDKPEVLRKWYKIYAEHRMCPDTVHPEPKFTFDKGQVHMDATVFDEMAHVYFDELGLNHAYTPQLFYAFGWATPLRPIFGLQPHTPEYGKALQDAYRMYINHVTQFGWRDKILYYVSDEPFLDDNRVVADLRYEIQLAKAVAPDVPIYASTWRHSDKLDGYLSMWGIGQYGVFPPAKLAVRLKAGDKARYTVDGQQALDTPYLAAERLLPIYSYKYGTDGYEFWGGTWWTLNPWDRGWHAYIPESDNGKDYYFVRYPDGDGYLFYPGQNVGLDEPVASLRAKAVREGAEDYEYYLLLDEAIRSARYRGVDVSAGEAALQAVRDLVSIPNTGGLRSTEIMTDPDAIYRVRQKVAEQILRLGKS